MGMVAGLRRVEANKANALAERFDRVTVDDLDVGRPKRICRGPRRSKQKKPN